MDRMETIDQERKQRAVLIGLNWRQKPEAYENSMKELAELAKACDLEVCASLVQGANAVTHSTYLGAGKVQELKLTIESEDADIVICNEELSPMQVKNLEDALDTEVLDRTGIILQIFATRAKSREARLQVESARLQYILPRLAGMRKDLSRQGGGSGRLSNKGAGEQQIELDRRRIEHEIADVNRQLKLVETERATQRARRLDAGIPRVSLVGYTNAGKSTLMNLLLRAAGADKDEKLVLEKDMLFATLDTAVRSINLPDHHKFLLTDTVGFVSSLPHSLVKAFRSTLEEAKYADLLLEVVDYSDPDFENQIRVTRQTLDEIGCGDIPVLFVYNKADLADDCGYPRVRGDRVYMSAKTGEGLQELLGEIDRYLAEKLTDVCMILPYAQGGVLHGLKDHYVIQSEEYLPEGVKIKLQIGEADLQRLKQYLIEE